MSPILAQAVQLSPAALFVLRLALGITAMWVGAAVLSLLLARASAALRHRLWAMSTLAAIALPALLAGLPQWHVGTAKISAPAKSTATIAIAPHHGEQQATPAPTYHTAAKPLQIEADDVANASAPQSSPLPTAAAHVAPSNPIPAASAPVNLFNWPAAFVGLWLVIAAWLLLRLTSSVIAAANLARRSQPATGRAVEHLRLLSQSLRVRQSALRISNEVAAPICVGIFRSCIVLPVEANGWSSEQLEAALTHELAHVARRDVLWQTIAMLACVIYWPHPLAWAAAWRMRIERELACDDWVLNSGESSTRYARWLLEIAGRLSYAAQPADRLGVAMARAGGLEARLGAILDAARRRGRLSRRAAISLAVAAIAITVPLAIINPTAAPSKALAASAPTTSPSTPATQPSKLWEQSCEIAGIVVDERGNPTPGVPVEFHFSTVRVTSTADDNGRFTMKIPGEELGWRGLWARTTDGRRQGFFVNRSDSPERTSDIRILLKPAREFQVSVTDQNGIPIAGAWIVAAASTFEPVGEAESDANGRAVLRVPADAELMYVLALKDGRAIDYFSFWRPKDVRSNPYRLDSSYQGPLHFELAPPLIVTVHVTDPNKHPLPDIEVYPWVLQRPKKGGDLNLFGDPRFHKSTDAQGFATVSFIPNDNERQVNIWTRSETYVAKDRLMFDPKSGSQQLEQVMRPMVHLAGQVADPDGKPAASASVLVGGDGYEIDSFRGNTRTDASGHFTIDIWPDKYYMLVARRDRFASQPEMRIVRDKPPANPIVLQLQPTVRVVGRATAGPERQPIANATVYFSQRDQESYFRLPPDQRFPGALTGRKAITPGVSYGHARTDADGRWEFDAPPGKLWMSFNYSSASIYRELSVSVQNQNEVDLHVDVVPERRLTGRVVLASNRNTGVPEATLSARAPSPPGMFVEGASDKNGNFVIRRQDSEFYISALTADGLRGITLLSKSDETATIAVGPTASVSGRLIDTAGRPIPSRPIRYGVRLASLDNRSFTFVFGGDVPTDEEGFFVASGLVPGFEYELDAAVEFNSEGRAYAHRNITRVKPSQSGRITLGDLTLPDPPKRKTASDYAAEEFHPTKALDQRMERARHVASVSYQRVLVLLGAPSDPAAAKFFDLRYGEDSSDVWKYQANYVLVALDAADADARNWAKQAGVNWPTSGFTAAIFEPDGKLLAQVASDELCVDGKLDRQKLNDFARQYIPAMPDGRKLLDDALARAKRENKRVLVDQSGPYCGWCVKLADYLQANRAIVDKDLIWVTLDLRFDHAKQILEEIQPPPNPEKPRGVPWLAILSADGKVLITSDTPKGNIGYPSDADGLAYWEKMLRTGAKNFNDADIKTLIEAVK